MGHARKAALHLLNNDWSRAVWKQWLANIFLPPYGQLMDDYLPVGSHSEVDRSSRNIEVALVLDVTGSMGGQKIIDLKAAAKARKKAR